MWVHCWLCMVVYDWAQWAAHVGPLKIVHVAHVGPMKNSLYAWKTSKFNVGLLWAMYGHIWRHPYGTRIRWTHVGLVGPVWVVDIRKKQLLLKAFLIYELLQSKPFSPTFEIYRHLICLKSKWPKLGPICVFLLEPIPFQWKLKMKTLHASAQNV